MCSLYLRVAQTKSRDRNSDMSKLSLIPVYLALNQSLLDKANTCENTNHEPIAIIPGDFIYIYDIPSS